MGSVKMQYLCREMSESSGNDVTEGLYILHIKDYSIEFKMQIYCWRIVMSMPQFVSFKFHNYTVVINYFSFYPTARIMPIKSLPIESAIRDSFRNFCGTWNHAKSCAFNRSHDI